MFSLCRNQVLRAGMDGTVTGLDHKAVIDTLRIYKVATKEMFEDVLFCWSVANELHDG